MAACLVLGGGFMAKFMAGLWSHALFKKKETKDTYYVDIFLAKRWFLARNFLAYVQNI